MGPRATSGATPSTAARQAAEAKSSPAAGGLDSPASKAGQAISPGSPAKGATPATATDAPAAPRTGRVQFVIKPWGEVIVDGKSRGVSPPLKTLMLSEGRHKIEIRNSTFRGYANEIDVKAGSSASIAYSFTQ